MSNYENSDESVVLCGAVLYGESAELYDEMALILSGRQIVDVRPNRELTHWGRLRKIDLQHCAVVPGLIDMHAHIESQIQTDSSVLDRSIATRTLGAAANVRRALRCGITTMRVLGTHDFIDVALRDAIRAGLVEGPDIVAAGWILSTTGGHGMQLQRHSSDLPVSTASIFGGVADGEVEVRRLVRYEVHQGVDLIKLAATSGGLQEGTAPDVQQFDENEIRAAVEEAGKSGRIVAVHSHGIEATKAAIRAGVRSVEHGSRLDDECIGQMVAHDVVLVPTLRIGTHLTNHADRLGVAYAGQSDREAVRSDRVKSFQRALESGVKVVAGSDSTYDVQHFTLVDELQSMVEAGMSPYQALLSATSGAAEVLGRSADLGVIRKGSAADLVAVEGDPLTDVGALRNIKGVIKAGDMVQ